MSAMRSDLGKFLVLFSVLLVEDEAISRARRPDSGKILATSRYLWSRRIGRALVVVELKPHLGLLPFQFFVDIFWSFKICLFFLSKNNFFHQYAMFSKDVTVCQIFPSSKFGKLRWDVYQWQLSPV